VNRLKEIKQRLELITGGIWEYDKHQEQLLARFGESPDELILIGELIDRDDADFFIKAKSDIEYLLEKVEWYEKALKSIKEISALPHQYTPEERIGFLNHVQITASEALEGSK
jgi:hypothetical protein